MNKCTYIAKLVMRGTSNLVPGMHLQVIKSNTLPEITKQVRKLVKLAHGNLIRTALIEDGAYRYTTSGRKKSNADINYDITIYVERGVA